MTTQVVVTSPKPNHHRLRVRAVAISADGTRQVGYYSTVLDDGESTVAYVYGTEPGSRMVLEIEEVPR